MTSTTFFIIFIPILSILLLSINLLLAPHFPYQEKDSAFECGFHSFLGQNRTQFSISFFIFGLLFLLFDLEIVLIYPYSVSSYSNDGYGLTIVMIFFIILTLGFVFELGKNALSIDSKQTILSYNPNTQTLDAFLEKKSVKKSMFFYELSYDTSQDYFDKDALYPLVLDININPIIKVILWGVIIVFISGYIYLMTNGSNTESNSVYISSISGSRDVNTFNLTRLITHQLVRNGANPQNPWPYNRFSEGHIGHLNMEYRIKLANILSQSHLANKYRIGCSAGVIYIKGSYDNPCVTEEMRQVVLNAECMESFR